MPLVVDQLRLWSIGFKWAGFDPDRLWLRIPPTVKDNFSTLLEAILKDQLGCLTLMAERWDGKDPEVAPYYVRHWLDDIYAAVHGRHFSRKLLHHAVVDRSEFRDWCERCSIPLPEFWFPQGWTAYRWPGDEEELAAAPANSPSGREGESSADPTNLALASDRPHKLRHGQKARIACQVIANAIWKEEPDKTIADMCRDDRILTLGDAARYDEGTVRRWVQEVAPEHVSAKRGRPRKKKGSEGE